MKATEKRRRFRITAVSKLKHASLYRAAKAAGSQAKLARLLGVHQSELGRWCNLQSCPSDSWTEEKKTEIEKKLFELTGETLDELFPRELRDAHDFLKANKVIEHTKAVEFSQIASDACSRLTLPSPVDVAEKNEEREMLADRLRELTDRERSVIEMRYGLNGHKDTSLGAIADRCGVTRERVRQIEAKAMRKLQSHKFKCFSAAGSSSS